MAKSEKGVDFKKNFDEVAEKLGVVDEDNVDARVQYATLTGVRGWNVTIEYKDDDTNKWERETYPLSKESGDKPSELMQVLKQDFNFTIINGVVEEIEEVR